LDPLRPKCRHLAFDHVIIAIKLPDAVADPSLVAHHAHPKLGRILFFDPTNELTPSGDRRSFAGQLRFGWSRPAEENWWNCPSSRRDEWHSADRQA